MAAKSKGQANALLVAALDYAKRGWRVLPLLPMVEGICTCREGSMCSRPGKHPAIAEWQKLASTDKAQVEKWWGQWPQAGIGIATGKDSGISVLDLDGDEGIADATARCGGKLPLTPRVRTGGGGLHLYFKYDDAIKNNAKKIGPLIDARNDGGYVVAPPSAHASGKAYEWECGPDVALADWPDAVRERTKERKPAKSASPAFQRYTLKQIEGAIKHIDAESRDNWRVVGIILAREFNQRQEAWDLYCKWADTWTGKKKPNHDKQMHEFFYVDSVKVPEEGKKQLTIGTLIDLAKEGGWNPRPDAELENFYYIFPAAKFLYRPSGALWTPEAVNAAQAPVVSQDGDGKEVRTPAARWIQRTRGIESMVFDPASPAIIDDMVAREQGMVSEIGARVFNTYYAPKLNGGDAAKATPYVQHVRMLYPDALIAEHILDYLAHRVQAPGQKVRHALLIGGDQGVGKDTIIEAAIPAMGQWNVANISPNDLFTPYDDHKAKVLIRINEVADLHDVNKFKFYEATKNLIAGTPDWTTVNQKYGAKYSVRNVAGVILTTNHIGVGLYIAADDRRHFVAEARHASELWKTKEQREQYFTKLWKWLYAGGFDHVAAFLHARDIGQFDPNAPPPKTEAFHNLVSNSAVSDSWLADALADMGDPEAVRVDMLRPRVVGLEPKEIARNLAPAMQRAGYEVYRNPSNPKDGRWKYDNPGIGSRSMVYVRVGFRNGKTEAELRTAIESLTV